MKELTRFRQYLAEGKFEGNEKNTNEGFVDKAKDYLKFRSSSQLGKEITKILDRLDNLPEVINARKEGMKTYKLHKLIRSQATPEEYKLLQYVVDKGSLYKQSTGTQPFEPLRNAVIKVYDSEIGLRMAKMGFYLQAMTDRYTGAYPMGSSPNDWEKI